MALRVLVNAAALRIGGGGTYIVEQLAALALRPRIELTVYASGEIAERLRAACGPSARVIALPAIGLARRLAYEQIVLPFRARDHDVVYQAGGFAMFASPRPQAVTNQNPHHFPASARAFWRERYARGHRLRLELEWVVARASVARAEAFITVSDAFRAAVDQDLGSRRNVLMIPSPEPRLPAPEPANASSVGGYALAIAHDYPHKDWDGLVEAFLTHRDLPRLVVAGGWRSDARRVELEQRLDAAGAQERVELLGPVADRRHIAALYRGASCYVAHSFLEAGPLTLGEARSAGVSIAASDIPPHREAAGAHARFYDPRDLAGLADAVRSAIARPALPERPARQWTWDDNAARLADILQAIATSQSPSWDN